MPESSSNTEFRLGELSAQVRLMNDAIVNLTATISKLDERLQTNERETEGNSLRLKLIVGASSILGGLVGTCAVLIFQKVVLKI